MCDDVEEAMNLRQKVVPSNERTFLDMNRGVFDLNKLSNEGIEFGLKSEELTKGVHDMLKIYLDSLYWLCLKLIEKLGCVFAVVISAIFSKFTTSTHW